MESYACAHANRANLLIHLVAVPLFILAHVGVVSAIACRKTMPAFTSASLIVMSLGLQRKGHKLEAKSPKPFDSCWDFAARLYKEQFYTFPKFVLSGEFQKNWLSSQSQN